ncbi:MAG: hypothetical protein IKD28_01470, partial [Clostridia bacterium]|nr:hypothetical protein [Clostridia bacterium]
ATLRQYDAAARPEGFAEYFSDLLLLWVEFATRDLPSVMSGARFCNRTAQATYLGLDALGNSLLYVDSANARYFSRNMEIQVKRGTVITNCIAISAADRQADGSLHLTLSGALVADGLAEGDSLTLTSLFWHTGTVLPYLSATSGVCGDLHDEHKTCAWRGKENVWGNRPKLLWDLRLHTTQMYYLPNYADWSASMTDVWQGLGTAAASQAGFVKSFAFSESFPHVMLPSETTTDRAALSCFGAYLSRPARGGGFYVTVGSGADSDGLHNPVSLRTLTSAAAYIGARLICE